jgi:crossover junction endodeoxyribonuclease RuvC
MRILGIDPGIATTGWAIVDFDKDGKPTAIDYGAILTDKKLSVAERLSEIYEDMECILKEYTPQYCGIETLLFYNNAKTAFVVGEARGVVLLSLQRAAVPIHEFTPLQVKSSITGYGRAGKKQIQENVKMICNLEIVPQPDDVADAIAIAIACFDRLKMDQLM